MQTKKKKIKNNLTPAKEKRVERFFSVSKKHNKLKGLKGMKRISFSRLFQFNQRKLRMSARGGSAFGGKLKFLKRSFRKLHNAFINFKLQRMRAQALKEEAGGNFKFKIKDFLRGLTGNKVYLRKSFALLTILAVIFTAYFQNTPYASAATKV